MIDSDGNGGTIIKMTPQKLLTTLTIFAVFLSLIGMVFGFGVTYSATQSNIKKNQEDIQEFKKGYYPKGEIDAKLESIQTELTVRGEQMNRIEGKLDRISQTC